jgi:hypothetical protein
MGVRGSYSEGQIAVHCERLSFLKGEDNCVDNLSYYRYGLTTDWNTGIRYPVETKGFSSSLCPD